MAGTKCAVQNGDELVKVVVELGRAMGLEADEQYRCGRRLWGAVRRIDVVLTHGTTRKALGIECKAQLVSGSVEEKIPATIQDIAAWPIPGLLVFAGAGFSANMKNYLVSTGKAVEFDDLRPWLRLFFGLPKEAASHTQLALDLSQGRLPPRKSDSHLQRQPRAKVRP